MKFIPKVIRTAHAKEITQFYLPYTRLCTNGMSHPASDTLPHRITALWPVLIFRPTEGRRLSWPRQLITYQGGMPASRWTPIPVPTDQ